MSKIKNISIENYRSIEALTFKPEKINVLKGQNGYGKTTVLNAIHSAYTGEFPSDCIKNGTDHTMVSITLDDGFKFTRIQNATKPNKVLANGRGTTGKALAEAIEARTGVSKDAMKIVTSAEVIDAMKPSEFGNFIMSYIPEQLDLDTVIKYIPGVTPDIKKEIENILPPMPKKFGMDTLKEAYDYFVEQRKFTKKEIASRKAKTDSFSGSEPTRNIKEIEKQLAEIIGKEASEESLKAAIRMYENALKQKADYDKNLESIKKQIDAIAAIRPNPIILENLRKEKEETEKTIINATALITTLTDDIESIQNTINTLDSKGFKCPISDDIVCTIDKSEVKKGLLGKLKAHQNGLEDAKISYLKPAEESLEQIKEDIKVQENMTKEYEKKILLNTQYENLKKHAPTIPTKPAELVLVDYDEEKDKLQAERDNYLAWAQNEKELNTIEIFSEKLKTFDFLCKAFDTKGEVIRNIIENYLEVFEKVCNARATALRPGFEMKFIAEDGVFYLARTKSTEEFRDYNSLSSGEKTLVMFLILDMLNTLTGLRLLMLDNLDNLDPKSFNELIELIHSADVQKDYDHIFICTVDHDNIVETLSKYSDINYI